MVESEAKNRFDAFICYETTTGVHFAKNLKNGLKKIGIEAFVAHGDLWPGEDEKSKRFSIIRGCEDFIIVLTNLALESAEVRKEIDEAIRWKRNVVACRESNVKESKIKSTYPELAKRQWITIANESDLADQVTSWYLLREDQKLSHETKVPEHFEEGLVVKPRWSVEKITRENNEGHIIFEVKNITGKPILIHGYRMFRIAPEGEKDFYYNQRISSASEFQGWISDPHVKIILWNNDEHIFHWNDVRIMGTYGINKKGKWGTEVQIAYIDLVSNTFSYSVGRAEIRFE